MLNTAAQAFLSDFEPTFALTFADTSYTKAPVLRDFIRF